jgi:hypothetical protein
MRAGLCTSVAAFDGGMPAGRGLAPLAHVPDREGRHGPPELVVGCKRPVIPVPVLAWRRDDIGEPIEELNR